MLSGCMDKQTSSEVHFNEKPRGVLSWTFNRIINWYKKFFF